jgi:hypothetical protein
MNMLYFGYSSSLNINELDTFLKESGYSVFDFTCMNVCKKRLIPDTITKTKNYIRKNIIKKT